MPDVVERRARLLTILSWVVASLAWFALWHLVGKLDYWMLCWPQNTLAGGWEDKRPVVQLAKFANIGLPLAATLLLPHHPRNAGRVAAVAITLSLILAIGLTSWVGSFYTAG